ncbi:sulfatase-like hydrolase/transferase [Dokdonella koreensis]|uniref:Sulfatase n=1 Tax=Dokdonella koreensis DS-123 TaxID=1300342 RepID=A0A160DWR8_9GAMM|nr:sulfatase-like hydrolase/transferase [Dokdonella koreensis]ANB18363.1 Sulfatase [Dokdonella koreensis DS-123]
MTFPPGRALAAITAVLALGFAAGCGTREPQPNVLLVTVDTLRPDALGFVNGRGDTPAIDALARDGRAFRGAVSPVPLTLPAHASILSGLLPRHHGVRDNGQTVPADLPLLPEVLRSHGYRTGAFVSGFPLQTLFGLDRGFDHYDDRMDQGEQGWVERKAADTVAAASAWIGQSAADRPWFGWVHFYDPHDPYEPPREFWQPGPRGAYDGEVAYTDYWLGRLLEQARQASGTRPLLVVLTADHAEALGEHREVTHGYFVYDSTMLVPLIFHWPGRVPAGQGDEAVQLIDVAPTILDLLGLDALPTTDGVSLAPGLAGGPLPVHPALVETWLPWTYYGWAPLSAWRDQGWKFIDAPTPELYALADDPGETRNLVADEVATGDRLHLALTRFTAAPARVAATGDDQQAIERLRSLGYVGVGGPVEAPPDGRPDPKDRIEIKERLQIAETLLRQQRFADAQAILTDVLAGEPDNRYALLRSGVALLRLGRATEAVDVLRRSVAIEPHRAEARFALGDALMRQHDYLAAAEQWAALSELQPRRAESWFNLAEALERAGEPERAQAARVEYQRLAAAKRDAPDAAPAGNGGS